MKIGHKMLAFWCVLAIALAGGGCEREQPVDNTNIATQLEKTENERSKMSAQLVQLGLENERLELTVDETNEQLEALKTQLDEVLRMLEDLIQRLKAAEQERDNASPLFSLTQQNVQLRKSKYMLHLLFDEPLDTVYREIPIWTWSLR